MWTLDEIPPQTGRRIVVTGTGGLGYETAAALARAGAAVVLAGRNVPMGREASNRIRVQHPGADIAFEALDLANLASVATFVERMEAVAAPIDVLINNAGVMALPRRQTTADGFEQQFGVNHLGHFALTGRLLPLLRAAPAPRVVTVSSGAHHFGAIRFDDLQWARGYSPMAAYAQSKLANLLFAFELQRRSDAAHWGLTSLAAHPGYARTDLIAKGPGENQLTSVLGRLLIGSWASQSAADGAWPQLFAATSPDAQPGGYYGPSRLMEMVGPPAVARVSAKAQDRAAAARLWEVSERLTGVRFG